MSSALYFGHVRHARREPRHGFRYRICMLFLDLEEREPFAGAWSWSARRPTLAWFRRADHLGDPERPLIDCARELVAERLGRRPAGAVRLLTHPRYFGFVFNPVSFYFLYDAEGGLDSIIAEVDNTPWGERHCYVLDARERRRFDFPKAFHVSPFFPMEQRYLWTFTEPGERLHIHMTNLEGGRPVFEADLRLSRRALDARGRWRALLAYPLMTLTVLAAIYWQALRLRLAGARFHPHPKNRRPQSPQESRR